MTLGPNMTMEDYIDTTTIYRQKLEIESLKSELARVRGERDELNRQNILFWQGDARLRRELTAIKQVVGEVVGEMEAMYKQDDHYFYDAFLRKLATCLEAAAKGEEQG